MAKKKKAEVKAKEVTGEKLETPATESKAKKDVKVDPEELPKALIKYSGILRKANDKSFKSVDVIPSGNLRIDIASGIGGYPRGHMIEIFGLEGTGKSTAALQAVERAQSLGFRAAYIDIEQALNIGYAKDLGVNLSKLLVSQPNDGEEAANLADTLCKSGHVQLVVIDSVDAMIPKAQLEGEIGEGRVAGQSKLMSQTCRFISKSAKATNTLVIFINQQRDKIQTMGYGGGKTTSGGHALRFYSRMRIELVNKGQWKVGEVTIGQKTTAIFKKNMFAAPYQKADYNIRYGYGALREDQILDLAVEMGIVQQAGSWYNYGDRKLGQGNSSVVELFREEPTFTQKLEDLIREKMKENK